MKCYIKRCDPHAGNPMVKFVYFILVVILFSIISPVKAGNPTNKEDIDFMVDSLDKELDAMPRDSFYLYKIVGLELLLFDSPRFLYYAELKEKEARRQNRFDFVCESYSDRALYYSNQNNIDSFYYWKNIMDPIALEFKEFNYYFYLSNSEVNLLLQNKRIQQAIQTAKKMYETAKENESLEGLVASNMSLGNAMFAAKRNKEAINSLETALSLIPVNETGWKGWKIKTYLGLISICNSINEYSKGLDYIRQYEELIEEVRKIRVDNSGKKTYMLNEWMELQTWKANFYIKLKKYAEAQVILKEVKESYPDLSEKNQIDYRLAVANYYEATGKYYEAFNEFQKAYHHPGQTTPNENPELLEQNANLLAHTGALNEAIKSYQDLNILKDSLNNAWLDSQLNEFRTIYDTDQLQLKNSELELKNKHNLLRASWIILAMLIVTLVFISIFYFRLARIKKKLQKSEDELKKERDELIISKENLRIAKIKAEEVRDMALKVERKESFFANMNHEIRTPLNAIVGFSNLLASDEDISAEERSLFINTINQNCESLLKLINDILYLSRMESGKMSFSLENYNLSELIAEVYSTHQVSIPRNLEFIKSVPGKALFARVDKTRLKQVVSNFINNAVKFTPEGHIRIGYQLDETNREIVLFVEDTGQGIPEEHQKKIFERFYKMDDADKGTGLGLSISTIIAEKLGGHLDLRSEVGKGSCFSIVLPYDEKLNA